MYFSLISDFRFTDVPICVADFFNFDIYAFISFHRKLKFSQEYYNVFVRYMQKLELTKKNLLESKQTMMYRLLAPTILYTHLYIPFIFNNGLVRMVGQEFLYIFLLLHLYFSKENSLIEVLLYYRFDACDP